MQIAFIGAGPVAQALSGLFKTSGHTVMLSRRVPQADAMSFLAAAAWGELVVIAIPFTATHTVLPSLAPTLVGKVVIDATNPLRADWGPLQLGEDTSGGEEVARLLPGSRVVKAFNSVFADVMRPNRIQRGKGRATAFLASDDAAAANSAAQLATEAGFAPMMAGPLKTARYLEALAHLNIAIGVGQQGGTNAAFIYDQGRS